MRTKRTNKTTGTLLKQVRAAIKADGPTIRRGKSKQTYGTPDDFLDAVRSHFGRIAFDLAATHENAVAPRHFSPVDDALLQPWNQLRIGREWAWLNPPFDDIGRWAAKCAREAARGARILFLVPASIGSNWFRDHVYPHATVHALNGRLTFKGETQPYPKDCMLCVFDGRKAPGPLQVWMWKN